MEEITPEQLGLWAKQYLEGTISAEDKIRFEAWYNAVPEGTIEWDDENTASAEALRMQIWQTIYEQIHSERLGLSRKKIAWLRYVAAALILLMAGTAMYWRYYRKEKPKTVFSAHLKQDLQPGGNKAVLTLSNGQKIVLDSSHNGNLVNLGNSRTAKVNNGLLAYAPLKTKHRQTDTGYNTLATPRGGQYKLILPDGTRVWLNAASSIYYPIAFAEKERVVEVTGEAYFEVAPNARAPFKVLVNDLVIKVLGTHFNVMAYKDETLSEVTLLNGAVNVTKGEKHLLLKPGEQAQLDQKGRLTKVKDVNVAGIVSWTSCQFWFDNADIQSVMKQVSRWYNADIIIKGTIPQHFTGYIPRNVSVSKLFEVLQETSHLHFSVEDGKLIVTP